MKSGEVCNWWLWSRTFEKLSPCSLVGSALLKNIKKFLVTKEFGVGYLFVKKFLKHSKSVLHSWDTWMNGDGLPLHLAFNDLKARMSHGRGVGVGHSPTKWVQMLPVALRAPYLGYGPVKSSCPCLFYQPPMTSPFPLFTRLWPHRPSCGSSHSSDSFHLQESLHILIPLPGTPFPATFSSPKPTVLLQDLAQMSFSVRRLCWLFTALWSSPLLYPSQPLSGS